MKLGLNKILAISLVAFWVLLSFQMLGVFGWIVNEETSIKAYHIFSLVFLFFFISYKINIDLTKMGIFYIIVYMIIVIMSAILLFPIYGFSTVIINYLFSFYVFFIGYFIFDKLGELKILSILQKGTLLINIIIICKLIYFHQEITFFLKNPYGHPTIYYIYGGGPNLEATWITLNSLFFINKKRSFYFLLLFSSLISIIYASRVSILMILLVYFFYFISNRPTKKERKFVLISSFTTFFLFGYFIIEKLSNLYVVKRFLNIGHKSEGGSQGRIILYNAYLESFSFKTLLGVGPGNALPYIEQSIGRNFVENNLHNYYLQVFLELGLFGFICLLIIVFDITKKNIRLKLNNPIGIFILCYLIGCLLQFRGTESFVWLCLGMFYCYYYKNYRLN